MDHDLLVLPQRPQQQQQQHVLLQHPVLLYTLLQHPLSSKYNVSASSDILAAASYATVAAVLIPGSTHMEVNVAATFTQNMSPVWALS